MDVVARRSRSCHNQTIFKKSRVYNKLVSGYWKNSLIVTDRGYTNSQYVVTPYLNPQNAPERLYNKSLIRTRNPVGRSYGVLKRSIPVLSFGSRLKLETTQAMIVACCILHNSACDCNDLEPPELLGMYMPVIKNMNQKKEMRDSS